MLSKQPITSCGAAAVARRGMQRHDFFCCLQAASVSAQAPAGAAGGSSAAGIATGRPASMNPGAGAADASSTGRRLLAGFSAGAVLASAAGRPGFWEQVQVRAAQLLSSAVYFQASHALGTAVKVSAVTASLSAVCLQHQRVLLTAQLQGTGWLLRVSSFHSLPAFQLNVGYGGV